MNKCVLSLLLLLNLLGAGVEAQQPGKLRRIGLLSPGAPPPAASPTPFDKGLSRLGYVEGQNIATEYRYPEGKLDRFPELAAELMRLKVDIIVISGGAGTVRAANNATKTIPIVIAGLPVDPVEAGLVESLARPGGNVTGLSILSRELAGKRRRSGEFESEVVNLLQTFGTQSALAIQNARLFREIEDKTPDRSRQSAQVGISGQHVARTAHAAQCHHRLLRSLGRETVRRAKRQTSRVHRRHSFLWPPSPVAHQRNTRSLQVEAGRMELELATFDLPLAIDNARTFVRERATKHGIALNVTVDHRLGDFLGDERKIKQILLNLLSNAVKFTPEGGRIGIDARQSNGSVEISVTDSGIGIALEDQPRIFESFAR